MIDTYIGTNSFIEILRYMTITAGGSLIFYAGLLIFRTMDFCQRLRYLALIGLGLAAMLQEIEQLGKPFLVWRLPMLLVFTVIGITGIAYPDVRMFWRSRIGNEPKRIEYKWPVQDSRFHDYKDDN